MHIDFYLHVCVCLFYFIKDTIFTHFSILYIYKKKLLTLVFVHITNVKLFISYDRMTGT